MMLPPPYLQGEPDSVRWAHTHMRDSAPAYTHARESLAGVDGSVTKRPS